VVGRRMGEKKSGGKTGAGCMGEAGRGMETWRLRGRNGWRKDGEEERVGVSKEQERQC
jgi:hypothetical protein